MTDALRKKSANRGFVPIIVLSLAVHVGVIGSVVYAQHRTPRLPTPADAIPVQLVQLGKPRDPQLLPRKVVEPPPAAEPEQGVALDKAAEEHPKPDPSAKRDEKKERKLSSAAKRLLEGSDNRLEAAMDKIDEREGDPDGDAHGTTTDRATAAQGYIRQVMKVLQDNYRLPETIPQSQRSFLKAEVQLFVERDGRISRFEFVARHPNEVFMGALDAMLKSIKLPPPPASEAATFRDAGLLVRFKPN